MWSSPPLLIESPVSKQFAIVLAVSVYVISLVGAHSMLRAFWNQVHKLTNVQHLEALVKLSTRAMPSILSVQR